jgi:integrase
LVGRRRPVLGLVRKVRQLSRMTPHTLRRTFASILAEVGVPPRRAMYLLGHTDPTLTMRVYQQVLDMGGAAVEQLEGAGLHDSGGLRELLRARRFRHPMGTRPGSRLAGPRPEHRRDTV